MNSSPPIVFCHYGNVDYLAKALLCASLTNPSTRKILLGDSSNKYTALACGWEHFSMENINSMLRSSFNENFKYIRGPLHGITKNGGDWLRFVFERWYYVQEFCISNNIAKFWHFDSDVMIVEDLRIFTPALMSNYDYTTQCNDSCLNGFIDSSMLTDFCQFIIDLFKNTDFIQAQQLEFDTVNPNFAFTEMRAFLEFRDSAVNTYRGIHLESIFEGWCFDDCICQEDDFSMIYHSYTNRHIKNIFFEYSSIKKL